MKQLDLRYVALVTPITESLGEKFQTRAATIRELVMELDAKYGGFYEMFINATTGKLNFNTMIYYGARDKIPFAVIDLDTPLEDGATVTFW